MKKQLFALAVILVFFTRGQASEKFLTGGVNISQFHDAISKPLPGYSIGFGWEWKKGRSSALLFSPSFLYRGVKLENKKIWDESTTITIEDIWCQIGYLELPFYYRFYFENGRFYLSSGVSLCLAVYDGSDDKILGNIFLPTHSPGDYDYSYNIDPGFLYISESSSLDLSLSSGIKIKRIDIAATIRISTGDVDTVAGEIKSINSNFATFSLAASWYF